MERTKKLKFSIRKMEREGREPPRFDKPRSFRSRQKERGR